MMTGLNPKELRDNETSVLVRSYLLQQAIFDEPPLFLKADCSHLIEEFEVKSPIFQDESSEIKLPAPRHDSSEMESLFGKLAPDLIIDPPIVLLWKNQEELPFLEKVAAAITQSVETAECREFDQKYFTTAKVILAEASLLQIGYHELQKNPIRLGMYKTSEYMKSVELKRKLWKLLQNIGDLLV